MPRQGSRAPWCAYAISACVLGFLALNLSAEVYGPGAIGADLRYHDGRSVVGSTVPGFPAALAGLGPDDIIVSAAGHPVRTLFHWRAVLENAEVARPLVLEIERAGRREAVSLVPAADRLAGVFERALSPDPSRRPRRASGFVAELERTLG